MLGYKEKKKNGYEYKILLPLNLREGKLYIEVEVNPLF